MRTLIALLSVIFAFGEAPSPRAAIPYFTNVREVTAAATDRPNYIVVDEEIWKHSKRDLVDLRLYAGATEIPYFLSVQRASFGSAKSDAKLWNLGGVGDTTHFMLDLGNSPEYDQISLRLSDDAKNFIARATVDGQEDPRATLWVRLGTFTLYDFSKEKLGANSDLRIPASRFRYLMLNITGLSPEQIKGASVSRQAEKKANWTRLTAYPRIEQSGKKTLITFDLPESVPLERLEFEVPSAQANFLRPVEIRDADGRVLANGTISRIHIIRANRVVDTQNLAVDVPGGHSKLYQVTIDNGDDAPLQIAKVQPLSLERRVYFEPRGVQSFQLYYGDPGLGEPVYDYAKLFQQDPAAAIAQLGQGMHNNAYTGRPDERPWSERHPSILWVALVAAVLGLGSLALRGLRSNPK